MHEFKIIYFMKQFFFILCSIIILSSCSKDDDLEEDEKAIVEAFITNYYQNEIIKNSDGIFIFITFVKFEKSTDKLEDSQILKDINRRYKEYLITKKEYENQFQFLNENFTGITYYVTHKNFIKYEDESKNSEIYQTYTILNNKGIIFYNIELGHEE